MKKMMLAILLMMATTVGFSQVIAKGRPVAYQIKSIQVDNTPTTEEKKLNVVYGRIEGNDTLLIVYLPEFDVDLMSRYYEIAETRQGRRLVYNVRKVYPYAKLASEKMQEFDSILANIPNDSERKQMMKMVENELTDQYTEELKNLTFSQGAILIRLIDRETGNTSYQVVQELRGKVRAFFYQGFARLWGYDLKSEYDPKANREDDEIETIVTLLERGQI